MLGATPLCLCASFSASLISTLLLIMMDKDSRRKDSLSYVNYAVVGVWYFYRLVLYRGASYRIVSRWYCIASHHTPHGISSRRIPSHFNPSHLISSHHAASSLVSPPRKGVLHQLMDNTPLRGNITRRKLRMRASYTVARSLSGALSHTRM